MKISKSTVYFNHVSPLHAAPSLSAIDQQPVSAASATQASGMCECYNIMATI